MFKCEGCGLQQPAKAKPVRVVAERRERTYRAPVFGRDARGRKTQVGEREVRGWEIAREALLCGECPSIFNPVTATKVVGVEETKSLIERLAGAGEL